MTYGVFLCMLHLCNLSRLNFVIARLIAVKIFNRSAALIGSSVCV